MSSQDSHRFTGTAAVVATVLVIPSTLVGGVLANVYKWFLFAMLEDSAWPTIVNNLMLLWFPSFLQGGIAGGIAISLTRKFFGQANVEAVMYSAAGGYITLGAVLLVAGVSAVGIQEDALSLIAQVVGIVFGLFAPKLSKESE